MDNSLKRKHPREGLTPLPEKAKPKTFLIGKELKQKTYGKPRRIGQAARQQNQNQNPRIAYAEGRVKPPARLLRRATAPRG